MIIPFRRKFKGVYYDFISDDTRDFPQPHKRGIFLVSQNAHSFIQEAKDRGAEIALVEDLNKLFNFNLKIVGITGTNGKTTTASMIHFVLGRLGYKSAMLGTRGFFIREEQRAERGLTTPSLLAVCGFIHKACEEECAYFIMEVSSHAIVQGRVEGLEFALRVLTNITSDHLDYHRTLENYRWVKNSFFTENEPQKNIMNADDRYAIIPNGSFTYGIKNTADIVALEYFLENGVVAKISYDNHTVDLNLPHLFGLHNLYNALAALLTLKLLSHIPLEKLCETLSDFSGVCGRMEVVSKSPLVIVDFAHTEDGMLQVFQSLPQRNIVVVFGAGGDKDKTKRAKMGTVASKFAQKIYLTNDNPRSENPMEILLEIKKGVDLNHPHCEIIENRQEAIKEAMYNLASDEVLLILGKGDEDYQIIGDKKIPFNDTEEVLKNLKNM